MNSIFRFTHKNLPKEFRPLVCPPLQAAEAGPWRIFRGPPTDSLIAAYFTNGAPMPTDFWVLQKNGAVMMSLTPVELQSQGYDARVAKGKVLVAGLGMGAVVYNLLKNPAVTAITACIIAI
jgi:hypothetical protein